MSNESLNTFVNIDNFKEELAAIQNSVVSSNSGIPPIADTVSLSTITLTNEDICFEVDADNRTITIPAEYKNIGVYNDHNAQKIYMRVNRYFDDVDLTSKICVVLFVNPRGIESYSLTNVYTDGTDNEKIIVEWTITHEHTERAGTLTFALCFYHINNEDGVFDYRWSTIPTTGNILYGLDLVKGEFSSGGYDDLTFVVSMIEKETEDRIAADEELESKIAGKVDSVALEAKADKSYNSGFIGGSGARLNGAGGAAIGYNAQASLGGAVGRNAKTCHGAAIGDGAQTVNKNGRALSRNPSTVDGLNIKAGRSSDDAIVWKPDGEPLTSYSYVQIISTAAPGEAPTLSKVKTAVYVGATELNNGYFMDTDGNIMSGSDHTVGANGCAAYFENGVLTLGGKLTINEASKIGNTPIWGGISGNKGNKSLGIELLPNADITINTSKYSGIYGNYGSLYIYGDGKLTINISGTSHGGIVSYHTGQPENVNILNGANVTITGTPISDGAGIMFETVSGNKGEVIVSGGASLTVDVDGGAITAIQLGKGINETEGSAKFFDYTMMNADGTIPSERLSGYYTKDEIDEATTELSNSISDKIGKNDEVSVEISSGLETVSTAWEALKSGLRADDLLSSKVNKSDVYTKTQIDTKLGDKSDKPDVTDYLESGENLSVTMTDNNIATCPEVSTLSITMPTSYDVTYCSELSFSSGATPTALTYPESVIMIGMDCIDNVFAPVANKRYTLMAAYNGQSFVGYVTGYDISV